MLTREHVFVFGHSDVDWGAFWNRAADGSVWEGCHVPGNSGGGSVMCLCVPGPGETCGLLFCVWDFVQGSLHMLNHRVRQRLLRCLGKGLWKNHE